MNIILITMQLNILFSVMSFNACITAANKDENSIFNGINNSYWITDESKLPEYDSLFYLNNPSPIFRKEFSTKINIEKAILFITAAGYYKASLNGVNIGKNLLDPGWTDFSKRIYYSEYNVKSLLNDSTNCLSVSLGNGFYNPLPLEKWGEHNLRDYLHVGKPTFIAELRIIYGNGETKCIRTDNTWKYSYGPILKNDVYLGVTYDANKEIHGCEISGFDDSSWFSAKIDESPGGVFQKSFFPPIQVTNEIEPVRIYSPQPKIYIVDMGINFTGTYKIKLSGEKGDSVIFRFGERIYEDGNLNPMTTVAGQIKQKGVGGSGSPDIAWQTDCYIIGDSSNVWFTPDFTYHVYRYMEIKGLNKKPKISDVQGLFFHSNVLNENSFICSSDLLNLIQKATERTFLANLISVQSDCAAREKFSYGGDLNATSESFIYNFDMEKFYRKTIYDWVDAINDSSFVDTAPYTGLKYCGISWESAFLITQYYLYLYYNDTEIIKELYELDKKWMDKVAWLHPEGIVDKGLSDHESMEPVPVQLTGTCHYLQCARIMKTFASVMGDKTNEAKYEMLSANLQKMIQAEFWDKPVTGEINRQTLFSTLLYHGIVPDNELAAAEDSLLNAVKNGPSGHFSTGIFGTKYILESLSEYQSPQMVFDIVNSKVYPGWGFMIDRGGTTIWETWKESDNTYSNCHPMFGTVTEWFYRWLGGIRPDPQNPGFKEFTLAPATPEGLEFVKCKYHCHHGLIISDWKKEQPGRYRFEITIPKGCFANVNLPFNQVQNISIELKDGGMLSRNIKGLKTGKFKLRGGKYIIIAATQN
jgi:alpha-L-rhamnosidase